MNGENLFYSAKLHWIVFAWPVFWFVVAIIFFSRGANFAIAGGILIFIAILTDIVSFVNYSTSEFGITTKRVIVKVGLIRRVSIEVLLNKVEGIQVNQGILGRIFGYGSITVSGTGGTKDPFHKIANPLAFRRKAQEQISAVQG
jgi:uncharacterized membrane protein YdbT with pleckstrin-like domain